MKKSKLRIALLVLVCVIVVAASTLLIVFRNEIKSILAFKQDGSAGVYKVNYTADYKLDELMENGGVSNEAELVEYILDVMLKGLPIKIDYEVPSLACSTFEAKTSDGSVVFGRNFDNEATDLAVVKTNPKNGYASVSVVNLSFLGYNENLSPEKIVDRIPTLAAPYFPVDGINEKGLAVGVLQIMAEPTNQQTDKPDIDTTLAIRLLLDKTATVQEAIQLLAEYDMHASANGCYVLHIADTQGNSAIVSYINNQMKVSEKQGNFQISTNFYDFEVPFEYKKAGLDRFDRLKSLLTEKDGVLVQPQDGMELLHAVAMYDYVSDTGALLSTQWSSLYDITAKTLTLCADGNYEKKYTFGF